MKTNKLWVFLAIFALPLLIACGGGDDAGEQATAPAADTAGAVVDESTAGTVKGAVNYDGPDPDTVVAMDADPKCAALHGEPVQTQKIEGEQGKLANVFVYVKSGLESYDFPTPTEKKTLDQQGCRYHPHVMGIQVGQPLVIKNSDDTLHNVHALPEQNQEFNQGQPFQNMEFEKTFSSPEVMVDFKCDVHPWMNAYIGVVDHPYYAVTDESGNFEIPKLPPGTYTLEAWHEELGTQTKDVTVEQNGTVEVTFDFQQQPAA